MDWNSSALWGIIGLVGGIIVSWFFHVISIKRKSITFEIVTTSLISNKTSKIKDLHILYKDKPINNLYVSTIAIINTGNTIIEHTDFSRSDPLTIYTDGIFLVDLEDEPYYKLIEDNKIVFMFDYIPKYMCYTPTVLHTEKVYVSGTLKDGKVKYKRTIVKNEPL